MGGVTEEERKKALKEILRQLHADVPLEQVKESFRRFLEGISWMRDHLYQILQVFCIQ